MLTYGGAVNAGGNILTDAALGLDTLEQLINAGYLNAPLVTPLIQAVGPVYAIPPFVLRADRFGLEYESGSGPWRWGVAIQSQVIYGFVNVPATFVDPATLNLSAPGYFQVTRTIGGRINLAQVYQLDFRLLRYFREGQRIEPYLGGAIGVGSGWLGVARSVWVQEAHLGVEAGLRFSAAGQGPESFWKMGVVATGFQTETRPTSFFDRTKVLVNPGRGNIFIVQLVLGAGASF